MNSGCATLPNTSSDTYRGCLTQREAQPLPLGRGEQQSAQRPARVVAERSGAHRYGLLVALLRARWVAVYELVVPAQSRPSVGANRGCFCRRFLFIVGGCITVLNYCTTCSSCNSL